MEIDVLFDEGFEGCLEASWLQRVAEKILTAQHVDLSVELGLVITGQEKIRQLNLSYLGEDEPTDVLAFSMLSEEGGEDLVPFVAPPDGVPHLGEVIISYPQAVIQAKEQRHSIKKEVAILIVHAVLHLLGYDHRELEPERAMRAREAEILSHLEVELE